MTFPTNRFHRLAATAAASVAAVLMWLVVSAAAAQASTQTFTYSPNYQTFSVPAGVNSVHVDLIGGSGANGQGSYGGGAGGSGGELSGDVAVTPGSLLYIFVGGAGQPDGGPGYGDPYHSHYEGGPGGSSSHSGFGDGNGGGGGGASNIADGTQILALAGGGGGGGGSGTWLPATDTSGGAGTSGAPHASGVQPAFGTAFDALNANGGAAGGFEGTTFQDDGGIGAGGGNALTAGGGGGGGGGGYADCIGGQCFSGGGGGGGGVNSYGGGGGAGGDSYASSSLSNYSFTQGPFGAGHQGQVTISYGDPTTSTLTASAQTVDPGQSVTLHAFVDPTDGGGTVSFTSDGTAISGCTNLPFASGAGTDWVANCTTSSLPAGIHSIQSTYTGDLTAAGSTAYTYLTVRNPTTTTLKASQATTMVNTTDTLTATVKSSNGAGTVSFLQDGLPISGCSGLSLTAAGTAYTAICKQSWAQPATHTIVANYSGVDSTSNTGFAGYAPSSGSTTVIVNSRPAVTSVSPNVGTTAGGQTVTITGTNLTGATAVSFGKTAATNIKVLSDSQLTAKVPAHAAGGVNVIVTTPLGKSLSAPGNRYTYDAVPTVSAISPSSGAKGIVVTVTGTGFVTGSTVSFGTVSATKVVHSSNTQLKATVPAGTGTVAVTVTNPGGTSATTSADRFTYTS